LHSNDPKKPINLNEIWMQIIHSRAKGYLMTCLSSNAQWSEDLFNQMGIRISSDFT